MIVNRTRVVGVLAVVGALAAFYLWFFQSERMLWRSWDGLIGCVQSRQAGTLRGYLAEDYADRWGYDRESLVREARFAFQEFDRLVLTVKETEMTRDGDRATITARMVIDPQGTARAQASRDRINALAEPFRFEWRREPGFPGAWKLVSFDQPELQIQAWRQSGIPGL